MRHPEISANLTSLSALAVAATHRSSTSISHEIHEDSVGAQRHMLLIGRSQAAGMPRRPTVLDYAAPLLQPDCQAARSSVDFH